MVGRKVNIKDIKKSKRYITSIAVHCMFTPYDEDFGAKDVDLWHMQRGWSGIGYHYIIRLDGTIEEGRSIDKVGAHIHGWNRHSIGISYAGGAKRKGKKLISVYDRETPAQLVSLIKLSHKLANLHNLDVDKIKGHNEYPNVNKSCPNLTMSKIRNGTDLKPMIPPNFYYSKRSLKRLSKMSKKYQDVMKKAINITKYDITIREDGSYAPYPNSESLEGWNEISRAVAQSLEAL